MDFSMGGAIKAYLREDWQKAFFSVLTISFPKGTAKTLIGICLLVS